MTQCHTAGTHWVWFRDFLGRPRLFPIEGTDLKPSSQKQPPAISTFRLGLGPHGRSHGRLGFGHPTDGPNLCFDFTSFGRHLESFGTSPDMSNKQGSHLRCLLGELGGASGGCASSSGSVVKDFAQLMRARTVGMLYSFPRFGVHKKLLDVTGIAWRLVFPDWGMP